MSNVLQEIQQQLKVPKNQYNSFGQYYYRSLEDILDAVKPILSDCGLSLIIRDEPIEVAQSVFVKATATLFDGDGNTIATSQAVARHAETKKGMDDSQITGATSSYARKYCLNGLFAIDDTKDADAVNTHGKESPATKATDADWAKIKNKCEKHGVSKEQLKELLKQPPMSCGDHPGALLQKHVDKVLELIEQQKES
jgi:hypothetical protein